MSRTPADASARVAAGRFLIAIVVVSVSLASCSGDDRGAGDGPATSTVPPTVTPSTSPPSTTTTPVDIYPAPHPLNLPDESVAWYYHAAPGATEVLFGIIRSDLPGPRPAVVLVPGSDGFNADYVVLAHELAARGFDVGFGCWWANLPIPEDTPTSLRILCPDAPAFKGVVDAAVPDVDALVEGVSHALAAPPQLAVVGFSRGGGIVALRASAARPEPIVLVAGMVDGTHPYGVVPGGEVNVLERVDGIHVPVLLLHAVDDAAVPVVQARQLEAALRDRGEDVEAHYYEEGGHGLAQISSIRADLLDRIAAFLCARFTCAAP